MRTCVRAHRRILTLVAAAVVAVAGTTGIAVSQQDAPVGDAAPFFFVGEQEIRAEAARRAPAVPLPARGSFDDIQRGALGESTGDEIQALLEANAACDWWSALAGRSDADAARVVQAIPGWSSMRDGGNAARDAQRVAAAAKRGGDARGRRDGPRLPRAAARADDEPVPEVLEPGGPARSAVPEPALAPAA